MKPYTDVFKKPLDKNEVASVVRTMVTEKHPTTSFITRRYGYGYGKALEMIMLLQDAGVLGPLSRGKHTILLKTPDAAVNAALRQLKKGKR